MNGCFADRMYKYPWRTVTRLDKASISDDYAVNFTGGARQTKDIRSSSPQLRKHCGLRAEIRIGSISLEISARRSTGLTLNIV